MESIRVDDNGLGYKENTAMNEIHFDSKDKLLDHLRKTMLHAATWSSKKPLNSRPNCKLEEGL